MKPLVIIKETWFSRPPRSNSGDWMAVLTLIFFTICLSFLSGIFNTQEWMPASGEAVFVKHEWWRLWTTLFAHGDFGHFLNNALLFLPLTYLLVAYFGVWFFPVLGILMGGLTNWLVLKTLAPGSYLIGMSGVVYWMGAAWFTLFILIDRRKNFKFRFGNVLFLMLMLFLPETYHPHISYLSHFVGFMLGVASALALYVLKHRDYESAEVREYVYEEPGDLPPAVEVDPDAEEDDLDQYSNSTYH